MNPQTGNRTGEGETGEGSRARPGRLAREDARRARARDRRRARLLRWGGLAVVVVALAGGGYLYFLVTAAPAGGSRPADPRITLLDGSAAPDFGLPSTDGREVRLSDYRGTKNVLLFFQEGAMCLPCWQQMRDLQSESAKLDALNVALVTIAVDPAPMLAETAAREGVYRMTLLQDQNARVSGAYQTLYVSMHPGERPGHTFVLVDTNGTIRWREDFTQMHVPAQRVIAAVEKAVRRQR